MAEERFHTIEEVAERLRVSDRTVRRWIESGSLRAYKPGGEWRIQASDLATFLETRSSPKAHDYPYRWMADVFANLIARMYLMRKETNPEDSYMLFRLALMVNEAVSTAAREIPETERAERGQVASQLTTIADDALEAYNAKVIEPPSKEALKAELRQNTQEIEQRLKESAS